MIIPIAAALALGCGSSGNTSGSGGNGGNPSSGTQGTSSIHGPSSTGTRGEGGGQGGAANTTSANGAGGAGGAGNTTSATGAGGGPASPGDSVLMHHKNPSRDGLYVEAALTKAAIATLHVDTSFAPSLTDTGAIYAQPLFVDGGGSGPDLVIVATETNNVDALDASDGHLGWTKNVGAPAPQDQLGCGNLGTYGITGTPVIDFASRRIFLDALLLKNGLPTHQIFALSIDTGDVVAGYPIEVPTAITGGVTFDASVQGQRGALAIAGGTLFVAYGGLYGDCGTYHGWIVGVRLSDPTNFEAWPTTAHGGGVWSMGGVSADDTNVYVATGNTFGANAWGGGEGMLRFAVGIAVDVGAADHFAPKNWKSLDNADLDLGTAPIPFDLAGSMPTHLAVSFGKDGNGYLVDRTALGGVGSAIGGPANCGTNNSCQSLHVASNRDHQRARPLHDRDRDLCRVQGQRLGLHRRHVGLAHRNQGRRGLAAVARLLVVRGRRDRDADGHDERRARRRDRLADRRRERQSPPRLRRRQRRADPLHRLQHVDPTTRYNAPIAAKGRLFVASKDGGGNASVVALKP